MTGKVSSVCGFPSVTAVPPYGAALVGTGRIEDAKNSMCYSGTLNVIKITNLKSNNFEIKKGLFSLKNI